MQLPTRLVRGSPRLRSALRIATSTTLDIREILRDAGDIPNLLKEEPIFDNSCTSSDDLLQGVPPFPTSSHRPPVFLVHSHRAQLPFTLHANALALGDLCPDEEDARIMLTTPTIPRMKLVIKEHLFVQKWVNAITTDHAPNHVPWTCDRPVVERKWVAEGSIFPAGVLDSLNKHRRTQRTTSSRKDAPCNPRRPRSAPCATPEASMTNQDSKRGRQAVSQTPSKPPKLRSAVSGRNHARLAHLRQDSQLPGAVSSPGTSSHTSTITSARRSIAARSSPVNETPVSTPSQPLAARRGKVVRNLQLKDERPLEELEYPDIPTAFRGSPGVWTSQFELQPLGLPFTGHRNMLTSLQSHCVALSGGLSTPEPVENKDAVQSHTLSNSTSSDEWEFSRDLASFEDDCTGTCGGPSVSSPVHHGPGGSESAGCPQGHTPGVKAPSTRRTLEPPNVSLPPRPALVNPASPPHVRSILKKSKNVRFEDHPHAPDLEYDVPLVPPAIGGTGALSRPSPLRYSFTVSSEPRPPNVVPFNAQEETSEPEEDSITDAAPSCVKDTRLMSPRPLMKASSRSRYRPIAIPSAKSKSTQPEVPVSKSSAIGGRQDDVDKDKMSDASIAKPPRNQRWSSQNVTDSRKGFEGASKGRLPTPLRNIFRFK